MFEPSTSPAACIDDDDDEQDANDVDDEEEEEGDEETGAVLYRPLYPSAYAVPAQNKPVSTG